MYVFLKLTYFLTLLLENQNANPPTTSIIMGKIIPIHIST